MRRLNIKIFRDGLFKLINRFDLICLNIIPLIVLKELFLDKKLLYIEY